jgi:hypothetical protein
MSRFTPAPKNGTGNTDLRCEADFEYYPRPDLNQPPEKLPVHFLRIPSFERSPAVFFRNIVCVRGMTICTQERYSNWTSGSHPE